MRRTRDYIRSIGQIHWFSLVHATFQKWSGDNCLRLGAAVSYCTLFSIFPLILVVLALAQLVLTDSVRARDAILNALAGVTGGFRDEFLATLDAVQHTHASTGILGVVMLLFGASWVFSELVSAFNTIWGVTTVKHGGVFMWMRTTFFSFALVFATGFLLLVSMVVSALLALFGDWLTAITGAGVIWTMLHIVINLGVLTLIFTVLLKYLPQTRVAWGDVWLGALLTAILWSILQGCIALVIGWSNYGSYGAIGAVLALVAWVYSSLQILFFGAEFSAVFAQRYGSRQARSVVPERVNSRPTPHQQQVQSD